MWKITIVFFFSTIPFFLRSLVCTCIRVCVTAHVDRSRHCSQQSSLTVPMDECWHTGGDPFLASYQNRLQDTGSLHRLLFAPPVTVSHQIPQTDLCFPSSVRVVKELITSPGFLIGVISQWSLLEISQTLFQCMCMQFYRALFFMMQCYSLLLGY